VNPVATRLLVAGAIAASLALLVGAVMLVIRLAQPPDYQLSGRSPDGEIVGRVAQVEAGVILVQSEVLGGTTVPLLLTKGTRITVGNREGWLGDISSGTQIKVAYELYEGKRLAQSVEVLDGEAARRPGPAEPPPSKAASSPRIGPPPAAPPVETAPLKPSPPAEKAAVKPTAPEGKTTPAPAAPAKPAPAPPAPVVTQPPAPRAEPPPAPRPRAPAASPRPPEAPVRAQEPARPPEPPRSREADTPDGSDAVDWLLKGRR